MKKLIVALAVIAVGIAANAASVTWGAQKGYLYDGNGDSSAKITSGTAYLVLSSYAQDDLVSAFAAANGDAATTLASISTLGTGTIGDNARISGSGTSTATDSITAYFVVFSGDKMYVSGTADSSYDSLMAEHSITFSSMTTSSKLTLQAADGYSAAGWYQAAAVPEPTSGLLLLLGMAGLALRRKRA